MKNRTFGCPCDQPMGSTLFEKMFPPSSSAFGSNEDDGSTPLHAGNVQQVSDDWPATTNEDFLTWDEVTTGSAMDCEPCDWMTDAQIQSPKLDRGTPTSYPGRVFAYIGPGDVESDQVWDDMWAKGQASECHYDNSTGGGDVEPYGEPPQAQSWNGNRSSANPVIDKPLPKELSLRPIPTSQMKVFQAQEVKSSHRLQILLSAKFPAIQLIKIYQALLL